MIHVHNIGHFYTSRTRVVSVTPAVYPWRDNTRYLRNRREAEWFPQPARTSRQREKSVSPQGFSNPSLQPLDHWAVLTNEIQVTLLFKWWPFGSKLLLDRFFQRSVPHLGLQCQDNISVFPSVKRLPPDTAWLCHSLADYDHGEAGSSSGGK